MLFTSPFIPPSCLRIIKKIIQEREKNPTHKLFSITFHSDLLRMEKGPVRIADGEKHQVRIKKNTLWQKHSRSVIVSDTDFLETLIFILFHWKKKKTWLSSDRSKTTENEIEAAENIILHSILEKLKAGEKIDWQLAILFLCALVTGRGVPQWLAQRLIHRGTGKVHESGHL